MIYQKKFKRYSKNKIDKAIHRVYSKLKKDKGIFDAFQKLLIHVQQNSRLIDISTDPGNQWPEACSYVQGISNLAYYYRAFLRSIDTWQPTEKNNRNVFASLIHHLLGKYRIPNFMNEVWLRKRSEHAAIVQQWYFKMANGHSIRKLNCLFVMTRKMEHYFLKNPDHFKLEESMRYAQVLGLGGNKNLAKAIIATRLGKHFECEDFWRTVIQFFIKVKDLNADYVNPIVDFLYYVKIAKREVYTENGYIVLDPAHPNFSMKGRTINSIMRLMEAWHLEPAVVKSRLNYHWTKSKISGFQFLEETRDHLNPHRIWSISELLSSFELEIEGRVMRHCVSTYASSCYYNKTTIWSMKKEFKNTIRRVLTIEIDPRSRTILQIRGKCNSKPNMQSYKIVLKWTKKEGLKFGKHH